MTTRHTEANCRPHIVRSDNMCVNLQIKKLNMLHSLNPIYQRTHTTFHVYFICICVSFWALMGVYRARESAAVAHSSTSISFAFLSICAHSTRVVLRVCVWLCIYIYIYIYVLPREHGLSCPWQGHMAFSTRSRRLGHQRRDTQNEATHVEQTTRTDRPNICILWGNRTSG